MTRKQFVRWAQVLTLPKRLDVLMPATLEIRLSWVVFV